MKNKGRVNKLCRNCLAYLGVSLIQPFLFCFLIHQNELVQSFLKKLSRSSYCISHQEGVNFLKSYDLVSKNHSFIGTEVVLFGCVVQCGPSPILSLSLSTLGLSILWKLYCFFLTRLTKNMHSFLSVKRDKVERKQKGHLLTLCI